MNINPLRNQYEKLTMLQRLALADNALGRDDDNEVLAIKKASPKVSYTAPDFGELLNEIVNIRVCNIIVRLGYIMHFDLLLQSELERELEKLKNKSNSRKSSRSDEIKLAGYLYVRATDAWNAISDEIGLRENFETQLIGYLFAENLLHSKDRMVRQYAFSEADAKGYILKTTGNDEFRTIEQEIEAYREVLGLGNR